MIRVSASFKTEAWGGIIYSRATRGRSYNFLYAKKLLARWRNEDWETGERLLPLQSGMRETGTACIYPFRSGNVFFVFFFVVVISPEIKRDLLDVHRHFLQNELGIV